ncbi:MAG: hypothetical protein ACYSW0_11305 [Planctomycetota bacterium]|jgi:hypothetical protein
MKKESLEDWQARSRREVTRLRQQRVKILGKLDMDDLFMSVPPKPTWETIFQDLIDFMEEQLPDSASKERSLSSFKMVAAVYNQKAAEEEPYILELYEQVEKLEQKIARNTADQLVVSEVLKEGNPIIVFLRENDLQKMLEFITEGGT